MKLFPTTSVEACWNDGLRNLSYILDITMPVDIETNTENMKTA